MRYYTTFARRGVRVAEGAAFEMRSAGNRRGGSNPSLSVYTKCLTGRTEQMRASSGTIPNSIPAGHRHI